MSTAHRPLDPRAPWVLDTRSLGRRAGAMKQLTEALPAPTDLGTAVIAVPPGSPVEVDLRMEAVVEGVLVTGTARAVAEGECGRCLDPVSIPVDVDLLELFVHEGGGPADDDEEGVSRLQGDLLDLEPVLRDQVVLDLPFQPVCRDDCPGLCAVCGARLADDPEHGHDDAVDPRWGALATWPGATAEDDA